MKKIIMRIIGAVCILTSLIVMFFPSWITIDNVSRSDFREFRADTLDDLENVKNKFMGYYEYNEEIKEELENNDLPYTKGKIKKRFNQSKELLKQLMDKDIKLKEVIWLSLEAPKLIKDTENLLETPICATLIFSNSKNVSYNEAEDVIDAVADYKFAFWLIFAFFVVLIALGLTAAATQIINKLKFFKFIFFGVLVLFVVAVCVISPIVSNIMADSLNLPQSMSDISLKVTVMPFVTIALSIVPIVLDIIIFAEAKKTKKGE